MHSRSIIYVAIFLVVSFIFGNAVFSDADVLYGTGAWTAEGYGNHRAVIHVPEKSDAVIAHVEWRRRDARPEAKDIIVMDVLTGDRIMNVVPLEINNEYGDIAFQPVTAPGDYYIYYMPYVTSGWIYSPSNNYLVPEKTYDERWADGNGLIDKNPGPDSFSKIPRAVVVGFESVSEFDRFDPMELVSTKAEKAEFLKKHPGESFLLFPESRQYPIRMTDEIPLRWIEKGASNSFSGEASRGEYFPFQIGLYAISSGLENVRYTTAGLKSPDGGVIPSSAITCFNLEGVDWLGGKITKKVSVEKGRIKPLWFGVDIPENAKPGIYSGVLSIQADNEKPRDVNITLAVSADAVENHGDNQLWRLSRLKWLNSKIALDDSVFSPYIPVNVAKNTITVLGRSLSFGPTGLPENITSTFNLAVNRTDAPPRAILARPAEFVIETEKGAVAWTGGKPRITRTGSGAVSWSAVSRGGGFTLVCEAKMECDGYVNYKLTVKSAKDVSAKDIRLTLPIALESAKYMMGMGFKGGFRPKQFEWKWNIDHANNMLWIGDVNAGIQCKLKHVSEDWSIYSLHQTGLYRDWSNDGKGGCTVDASGNCALLKAYTGEKSLKAGEELHFNFGLLITPVKPLDADHWTTRYYQNPTQETDPFSWIDEAKNGGANVINVHQGNSLNPYINYPFLNTDKMTEFVRDAENKGIKTKIYYTVRELSNYTKELWALRSLDGEVYMKGKGFRLADQFEKGKNYTPSETYAGHSWLCEHLVTDYTPAWHQPLGVNAYDASIATVGLSRWHNYYLEGLNWLVRNVGISGLYLDGIGYDREIMKRERKVMDRARSGCLIDFHSGNNYDPRYGLNSPANQYMELFPCVNSLWFGEGYDYNETPDYWLVEVSGIPFGLYSEMLHGGGNPWRGMVYGMTNRLGWSGDAPTSIWKLWDSFGIKDAEMLGYWDDSRPVKTDNSDVLATVYLKKGKALVSIASWAKETVNIRLSVDLEKIGLSSDTVSIEAPEIEKFQPGKKFSLTDSIPVEPGKGWLLLIGGNK